MSDKQICPDDMGMAVDVLLDTGGTIKSFCFCFKIICPCYVLQTGNRTQIPTISFEFGGRFAFSSLPDATPFAKKYLQFFLQRHIHLVIDRLPE